MSVEAITWALKRPVTHSSAKFVLVVLANCARAEDGMAYPSIAYLCDATGQDRKTVIANLARLIEWGFISDSGERAGRTRQVVVYRMNMEADLLETVPKAEPYRKRNSSDFDREQSRFSLQTVPKTGHGTVNNHQVTAVSGAGAAAVALRKLGVNVTSQNPDLIAAVDEGVTADYLVELAGANPGKPAAYLIAIARRERSAAARAITHEDNHAPARKLSASEQTRAAIAARRRA